MEVISSNKGGEKLCINGFMYVVHKKCANGIRWRYCKYSSLKCRAILKTTLEKTDPDLTAQHNHPTNHEEVKATKCVETMKKKAKDTTAKPLQIYAEAVSTLENSTRAVMPSEDSAKRTLRNYRTQNLPRVPMSLEELLIEGEWCTTADPHNNERFLLHDSGVGSAERVVIFATDECLSYLADASAWYVDGNFSMAPPLFMQLYVIRAKVQGLFVTCSYSLLQRKTQSSYEMMLQTIMAKCNEKNLFPDPSYVFMDFEKATIQAVKEILGEHLQIRGCFYHLAQSTHRKIQALGLERRYREDEQFVGFCGMIDGLAFLPLDDVPRGMEYLKENVLDGAEDLLDYFDATYVTGTFRRIGNNDGNIRLRNIPAIFPPDTWNVHRVTLDDDDRTNNQTEGWNHRFANLVGQTHPSIWILIQKMRQELAADKTKVEQQRLGRIVQKKKRKQYEIMQTRLKALCQDYNDGVRDLANFLNAVSHNIRFEL